MCTDFELEGFKSMKMQKIAFSSNFHAFSLLSVHKWDTCYANFSYFWDKSQGFGHCAEQN